MSEMRSILQEAEQEAAFFKQQSAELANLVAYLVRTHTKGGKITIARKLLAEFATEYQLEAEQTQRTLKLTTRGKAENV